MKTHDLVRFLLDCEALRFGDFTLKSGKKSPFFIDIGQVKTGRQLATLGEALADAVREKFPAATFLFGPAYKGISLATATATASWYKHRKDVGVLYDRKEAKAHGEGGQYIGRAPQANEHGVMIDDVLTSGLTKRDALAALQKSFGITGIGILVVVDRRTRQTPMDLPFAALLTLPDLIDYLKAQADPRAATLQNFWETEA